MNVASRELCKELYELSGWAKETPYYWTSFGSLEYRPDWYDLNIIADANLTPAYDLGFLWRKFEALGNDVNIGYHDVSCDMTFAFGERGTGSLLEGFGTRINVEPEDCIEDYFCQFFIDLFQQDILTPTST